jgi:hypothetical protein
VARQPELAARQGGPAADVGHLARRGFDRHRGARHGRRRRA